jgi:autotransporter strand-loop-strand O-heptosyltransferase
MDGGAHAPGREREQQVSEPEPRTSATSAGSAPAKSIYPPPADLPTQPGPRGIRFDFNQGARVVLPNRAEGSWRVRLRHLDTGNVLFESENKGAFVRSSKRYYIRFRLEVSELNAVGDAEPVFTHDHDCTGRDVLMLFPVGTLGDILAWFPYAAHFGEVHGCRLICAMSELIIPLLRDAYPDIRFVTHEELQAQRLAEQAYTTYCLGLFFDDTDHIWQPTDFRHVGLHRTAAYILGVDPAEQAPRLALPDETRPMAEPYVCIAVQSSTQCKNWNNPNGWRKWSPSSSRAATAWSASTRSRRTVRAWCGTTSRTARRTKPETGR